MATKLRKLDFYQLDELIAEIERLRDGGYTPRGKWNLSQVCDHLTETMRIGMDGDEPRVPWPMRKVFGAILWVARKQRVMMRGAPTIPRLTPEERDADDPERIDRCLRTLAEARDFAGPLPPYPLCDGMTVESWQDLMVVHGQHHLRFLEPGAA
ncbi:MAG: DUF1569 domain-containing protein [Planctomycetota bacterium]